MQHSKLITAFMLIALMVLMASLFSGCSKAKVLHECTYKYCPFKGQTNFVNGCGNCVEGSDCWELDHVHFDHPTWSYDECENYLFAPMKNRN